MSKVFHLQASLFGDFKSISVENQIVFPLYQVFMEHGLMPAAMKEYDVIKQELKNRPFFVSQDNSYSISIGSARIDISSEESAGAKMPSKEEFIERATFYMDTLFDKLHLQANRVSFISEKIIKIVKTEEDTFSEGQKYLNLDRAYYKEGVFEWSANTVSNELWSLNDLSEPININVTVAKRNMIKVEREKPQILPLIVLTQDINSKGEIVAFRFSKEHVKAFLATVSKKSDDIEKTVIGE